MSTICFNIKRTDDKHVCICNVGLDEYKFSLHHSFAQWGSVPGYDTFPEDENYIYLFIIIGKSFEHEGIEEILLATDSSRHAEEALAGFEDVKGKADSQYYKCRIIKIPFLKKIDSKVAPQINDLGTSFELFCPKKLNLKYHVYGDRKRHSNGMYEFVQPEVYSTDSAM